MHLYLGFIGARTKGGSVKGEPDHGGTSIWTYTAAGRISAQPGYILPTADTGLSRVNLEDRLISLVNSPQVSVAIDLQASLSVIE